MSFSGKVKEELSMQLAEARHCQIAELTAIITMCGRILIDEANKYTVLVHTENQTVARKFFTLLKETFKIISEVSVRKNKKSHNNSYTVAITDHKSSERVLQAAKLIDEFLDIREDLSLVSNVVVQNTCCKRAFLRGAFLAAGSMSNPTKGYHYEIVANTYEKANQLGELINTFGLDAKVAKRKSHYLVYLKEGAQIVDMLNVMEAHQALMDLENVRILKEVRNSVNRQVNCETANINKTVLAATRQVEDIKLIQEKIGLHKLPKGLLEIAELRLAQPEASLKELGMMLDSPIGKSGVNHRLKKLEQIADRLREKKEENLC